MTWNPHFGEMTAVDFQGWLDGLPPAPDIRASIVLASEERTGSEWLCQMMYATGVLGRPSEYLNAPWFRNFVPDYPVDVASEIRAAHRAGVSSNGIFSMKLHMWHFDKLIREGARLTDVFPNATFVWISRRDRLAQAISIARARQTNKYHDYWPSDRTGTYNPDFVTEMLREMVQTSARWTSYFARTGIEPLRLYYEDLQAEPFAAVRAIGQQVGVEIEPGQIHVERALGVQRDETTQEWRRRFIEDCGDRNRVE